MSTSKPNQNRQIEPVDVGLEVCLDRPPSILAKARFGLLMNQASVDRRFRYAHRLLAERFPGQLRAIFSPQHGLWGEQQDNMIASPHGRDTQLGVPIHSLYSETRWPTSQMLEGIDLLVVDLQDVGTRVYTFIWTISYCLEACRRAGIPVLVLDRPNPLGGELVEGPCLRSEFASFVGRAPIPMRHALTTAELVSVVNTRLRLGAEVHVVAMRGWHRAMRFSDTGRCWVPPSPNLPRVESVAVYPGQVLLEGTELSEGRGTTTPFEVFGAPFVDPMALCDALGAFDLRAVAFRPLYFRPTFQKHCGVRCGGLCLHVLDASAFRPYRTTLAILACVHRLWPEPFRWLPPPYEYESRKMPIDILSGDTALRRHIDRDAIATDDDLSRLADVSPEDWLAQIGDRLMY